MPLKKRIKRWTVYALARFAVTLWALLPTGAALAVGRLLGALAYRLAGRLRRRAQVQIADVLEVDAAQADRVTRGLFRHLGMVIAEMALMPRLLRQIEDYVHLADGAEETMRAALAEGRGVVLVTGHIGNWELLAQRLVLAGFPGTSLARANPNPYIARWLHGRRTSAGMRMIDRDEGDVIPQILAHLKEGRAVGLLIDQDTRVTSAFVPFLGRPAATPVGPARIALRGNVPVVVALICRSERGHLATVEPMPLDDLTEGTEEERIQVALTRMNDALSAAILRAPEQWVWFHKRWRRKPPA